MMKKKKLIALILAAASAVSMAACASPEPAPAPQASEEAADTVQVSTYALTADSKPASEYTVRANEQVYALLDFNDTAEDADVTWTTNRMGLLSIVQKNADGAAALITQDGDETCLTALMDAVTVVNEFRFFNLIEP